MIVSSNHTRIGAWVNGKMFGRNSPVYCTIPLTAMQGYQTKTEDTISLDYNSICYITSRIGWVSMKGIFKYRCRLFCLKENQNAPRLSEHPPVRGKNVKTFRWDHRLQIIQNLSMAFKRLPL